MFPLPVPIGEVTPPLADPTDVLGSARAYADADTSASTQRAYAGARRDFEAWCRQYRTPSLPASPGAVAAWPCC